MASLWHLDNPLDGYPTPELVNDERYSTPSVPQSTTAPSSSISTDVATLHTINKHLQAELDAFKLLAATLARQLQDVRGPLTSAATATATTATATTATSPSATTTAPLTCPHANNPCTISSGRGAASPEVFQEIIKTNWHGRLGRTHMVDVDALPAAALTELDCFLRRKLHATYPRGRGKVRYNTDEIFASLAALGLRLEDRGPYADVALEHHGPTVDKFSTIKRGRKTAAWFMTHEKYADYWEGSVMETMLELARYRGLFDDEGYLKE